MGRAAPFPPAPARGARDVPARPSAAFARRLAPTLTVFLFLGLGDPAAAPTNPLPASDVLGQTDPADPTRPSFTKGAPNDGPHAHGVASPGGIAVDPAQRLLFLSDTGNNRVLVFELDAQGGLLSRQASFVLGQSSFQGNGAATSQTGLRTPEGLALDLTAHRLYVADSGNNRVLVFPSDRASLTQAQGAGQALAAVAVLGQTAFTASSAGTTAAKLWTPRAVALDPVGQRLFVADTTNHRVLVFDTATLANGEAAVAVLGQADFVSRLAPNPPAASSMSSPQGVAFDAAHNRLAIADSSNIRVLLFDAATLAPNQAATHVLGQSGFTTRTAGTTATTLRLPIGLAFDVDARRLFVADSTNNRVVEFNVDPATLVSGAPASLVLGQSTFTTSTARPPGPATLTAPNGLALAGARLWVADRSNHRILAFDDLPFQNGMNAADGLGQTDGAGNTLFTKGGANDGPTPRGLDTPGAAALDRARHRLFVADTNNHRVLVYQLDAGNALPDRAADLVLGQADFAARLAPNPPTATSMSSPQGVAYDEATDRLYVADAGNHRVLVFDVVSLANGEAAIAVLGQSSFTARAAPATPTDRSFNTPRRLALASGRLYVSDNGNNRVLVFDTAQITPATRGDVGALAVLGQPDFASKAAVAPSATSLRSPQGLAVDVGRDRLFVADTSNNRVLVFDTARILPGTQGPAADFVLGWADFLHGAGSTLPPIGAAALRGPQGVAVDPDQDRLFVAEATNHRVLAFDLATLSNGMAATAVLGQTSFTSGTSSVAATADRFNSPPTATFDIDNTRLYVTDQLHHRLLLFDLVRLSTATLPAATAGQAYSVTLGVAGGQGPFAFDLAAGTLPAGLTVDPATGRLSGTPTTPGQATFSVRVRDAQQFTFTKQYTLDVAGGAPTLVSIAVTPGSPSIAKGLTQQFTATGTFSDGSTQDLTGTATWTSTNTAVATISAGGLATGVGQGTAQITATKDGVTSPAVTLTVAAPVVVSIAVTPSAPSIAKGLTQQFTATGTYTDGSTQNITGTAAWASSNTAVATISAGGLASGVGQGTSQITAASGGVTSPAVTLTVTAPTLVSIGTTPVNPSVAKGLTRQFTATGTYTDASTQNLTSTVAWSSSNTAVATINTTGLATAVAQGTATIQATQGAVSGQTTLTVTAGQGTLVSIAVTPATASIAKGLAQQFTATATFSDGATQDVTTAVTWTSSNTTAATINAAGLATSVWPGTAQITAGKDGVTSPPVTLTVTPAVMASIRVTPPPTSIPKGQTVWFGATGVFTDGATQSLAATWSSSDPTVATIIASNGLASTLREGTTTIQATYGGVSGQTTLTVTPPVLYTLGVTPINQSVRAGSLVQYTATGTLTDGSTQNLTANVTWGSTSTGVATITSTGLATAKAAGTTTIRATLGALQGSTALTVQSPTITSIAVTPANPTVPEDHNQQFTATATYSNGSTQNITSAVTWSSTSTSVATIGPTGLAATLLAGTTTIKATWGTVIGQTNLTVTATAPTLTAITVTPANPSLAKGLTQQFTATGTYSDGTTDNLTSAVTWSSTNTTVATITSAGLATAKATGTATIRATRGTISGQTTFTVTAANLQSLTITPANPNVPLGSTQQFTATGRFSDASQQTLTSGVTWTTDTPGYATITATGLATAVAGPTTVRAAVGSVSASTLLNVTAPVLVSLAVAPATASVPVVGGQQFTATGTMSDGTTQDLTATATWTSSDPTVATVSAAGAATALAPGTVTITARSGSLTGTATLTVSGGPLALLGYQPERALAGQPFTLRGPGFGALPTDHTVTFAGPGGARLPATVTAVTPGQLTVTVPAGAQTGLVTVAVGGQSASLLVPAGPDPTPAPTDAGKWHDAVATDPSLGLAVLPNDDRTVTLFDLGTQTVVATLGAGGGYCFCVGDVAVNAATHTAVVTWSSPSVGYLTQVDLVGRAFAGNISPELTPSFGVTFRPGWLYGIAVDPIRNQAILSAADDHLWVVDLAAGRALRRVPVGGHGRLALDAARGVAVLVPMGQRKAVLVDLTADRIRQELPLLDAGQAVALDAATQRAVVALDDVTFVGEGGPVIALDLTARATIGTTLLKSPRLGIDGGANLVVTLSVFDFGSGTGENAVIFSDLRTGGELRRVPLGSLQPRDLAFDPVGRRALVLAGGSLAVIPYGAIIPGPRVDAFTPDVVGPGAALTLRGAGLDGATVTVPGPGGVRLVAPVSASAPDALTATLPSGVASGPVQVTTTAGVTPALLPLTAAAPKLSVQVLTTKMGSDPGLRFLEGTLSPVAPGTAVMVNGVSALVQGPQWRAADVPVPADMVIATATDPLGNVATAQLSVFPPSGTPVAFTLSAAPPSGAAPLTTTFQVTTTLAPPTPAAPYHLILNGDGPFGLDVTGLPLPPVAYLVPGLYQPSLIAGAYTARTAIRADFPNPPPALIALSLTPESPTLGKGEALFMDAVGLYADGSSRLVTTFATWTSADPTVATVSGAGTVKGLAPGETVITATLGTFTIATPVTVTPPQLDAIAVMPLAQTILRGETVTYTATGQFSDGTTETITSLVTWTTGDGTIATVDATGRARGAGAGTTSVTATLGTIAGSATLTVNPPLLQSLTITPSLPSLIVPETLQLTATGTYSDGTTQDLTTQASWTSTTPTVASVSNTGLATALAKGSTSIIATFGGFSHSMTLTVLSSSPLSAIQVTNPCAGCQWSAGGTVQFTATGTFQDGSTQNLTLAVTWASSDPTVATIGPGGQAHTLKTGTTTITATRGAVSGTDYLRVFDQLASLEVTPATPTKSVGQTLQFTATGVGLGGQRFDVTAQATWTSSTPAVATITSPGGLATAIAPGTSTVTARFVGPFGVTVTGSTPFTVLPVLTALTIPPGILSSPVGESFQLQALGTFADASTRDLTALATWASSNPAVATVTVDGLVTARALGVANITATRDGITGTLTLTVTGPRPTLTITSPAPGAIINADRVIVRGTVSGATGDIGVVVNGIPAFVNGSAWATQIPLEQGTSAITVTATDATGAAFSTSLTVSVPTATPAPLILEAFPAGGASPLTVTWHMRNNTGRPLVLFELDADGDGTVDLTATAFNEPQTTFTGQGLVFPVLRATDDQGATYTATAVVNVGGAPPLAPKWEALKAALRRGDIPAALSFIHSEARARYEATFRALTPGQLATIDQYLTTALPVEVGPTGAEYQMRRPRGAQTLSFPIWFQVDTDGIWRIRMF